MIINKSLKQGCMSTFELFRLYEPIMLYIMYMYISEGYKIFDFHFNLPPHVTRENFHKFFSCEFH